MKQFENLIEPVYITTFCHRHFLSLGGTKHMLQHKPH